MVPQLFGCLLFVCICTANTDEQGPRPQNTKLLHNVADNYHDNIHGSRGETRQNGWSRNNAFRSLHDYEGTAFKFFRPQKTHNTTSLFIYKQTPQHPSPFIHFFRFPSLPLDGDFIHFPECLRNHK